MEPGPSIPLMDFSWDRILRAEQRIHDRVRRVAAALQGANVPYAIVGGIAVASWVGRVDEILVRLTRDIDILLRRPDFPAARAALEAIGFTAVQSMGIDIFTEPPITKLGEAVHVLYAGETVRPNDLSANPDVIDAKADPDFSVIPLEALVIMKLTAFRDKDRVHVRDMMKAQLVDATWLPRLSAPLAARLQELLDTPNG